MLDRRPLLTLAGPALAVTTLALDGSLLLAAGGLMLATLTADHLHGGAEDTEAPVSDAVGRWLPRACVPAQLAVVLLGAQAAAAADAGSFAALCLGAGLYGTTFGINVAHELIHARSPHDRALGGLLLAMVGTGSFKVEHIRGHHKDVATERDPASAPRGRSLWAHLPQAVLGNWRKGWALESARLRRRALPWHQHELLRLAGLSLSLVVLAGLLWGPAAAVFVVVQGLLARTNLEIINYVEHYGLRRARRPSGRPEPVSVAHSWSSEHAASRALLFNLPRHADHHAHASRPWTALRHHAAAPTLPAGYAAMFLLAMVPPLWFRVMDPRLPPCRS